MSQETKTFAAIDRAKGIASLPEEHREEMPLPAWYRSVYQTPLEQLTIDDLSKAGRQGLHPEHVVPIIIARLGADPLAGEMFEGELLASLRSAGADYWKTHRSQAAALKAIIDAAWSHFPEDVRADAQEIQRVIV